MFTDKQKTIFVLVAGLAVCLSYLWSWVAVSGASRDIIVTTLVAGLIAGHVLKDAFAIIQETIEQYRTRPHKARNS